MNTRLPIIFLIALLLFTLFIIDDADAIPAFARRYKISCNTCHAPFPKLKPYGDDFAGSGFILQENEKERDYVTAGDDLLWMNKEFPVAARFDAYGVYESDNDVQSDLQSPYGLKLLSGGTLYKNIGYYFYFYMSERGEVAGVEDAYVHFDNVFKTNLDIMVGQFQTSDPLMKRELRLTYEDYQIYKAHVGSSQANLAYDRGVMLVYGIEQSGTDIIAQIVNGNGIHEAGENRKFDADKFKNYGLRLNQGIGNFASIGLYYYSGEDISSTWDYQYTNNITYWGPDINIGLGPLELTAQYLVRQDSNPLFNNVNMDIATTGIIAELIYAPRLDRSRWYLTALYNKISSDLDDVERLEDYGVSPLAYHSATLSGTYLLSRNLRLIAEYTREIDQEINRIALGFVTAY
ncbi:hypothetical protein EH223_17325 [candidate division KSB1 bacterium]|nr:hypothetical protein [candidate division KSB1 bacterium]RQW00909.1 MAG: hypothetical protein EH223_17325 [candidate division KSB1 bacterium]